MKNRLMGLSEEERLAIEQTTGLKTQGAQIIVDAAVQATQEMMDKAIREVQEVIGPHGAVTRLQAGGVQIAKGLGIAVYEDGILKTTVDTTGNLFVGSDTTSPTTTSFSVFVNDQIYNNEQMGAGDLLIGDNSSDASNVKYDASEGQLQFRLGTTVNVYVDTDGKLKAGGGAVTLDESGILLNFLGDAILFENSANNIKSTISQYASLNHNGMRLFTFKLLNTTSRISNGDFETGDFTSWTESDTAGKISISNNGEGYRNIGYSAKFTGASHTSYLQQSLSSTSSNGVVIKFKIKGNGFVNWKWSNDSYSFSPDDTSINNDWETHYVYLPGSTTFVKLQIANYDGTDRTHYVDDIYVYPAGLGSRSVACEFILGDGNTVWRGYTFDLQDRFENSYLKLTTELTPIVVFNETGNDVDLRIEGNTDQNLFFLDAGLDAIGIGGAAQSGYKLKVHGKVNLASGNTYDINGSPHTHASTVSDTAYDSSWNGDTTNAPSKNTVYDKIETMPSAAANITDNAIVRGDGGAKGLQESVALLDDTGFLSAITKLLITSTLQGPLDISDSRATGWQFTFRTLPTTPAANDAVDIAVNGKSSTGVEKQIALLRMIYLDPTNGSEDTAWDFYNRVAGTNTLVMRTGNGGNVEIGAAGSSGKFVLSIANGTAPSSSPANAVQLYAEDVASSSELKVRDEAGNITTLSPHAKDGPSWLYDDTPGLEEVHFSANVYTGKITYTNETRKNKILQNMVNGVSYTGNKTFVHNETFADYNTRTDSNLSVLNWDENQEALRIQRQAEIKAWDDEKKSFDDAKAEVDEKGKKKNKPSRNDRPRPAPYVKKKDPYKKTAR